MLQRKLNPWKPGSFQGIFIESQAFQMFEQQRVARRVS
jgi:hypothetical protein